MDARDVGASTVVEVRALSKRYGAEGRKHDGSVTQALDRVSFAVACGEFTGIMGPSGSGKSTLLNCLATIDKPSSGTIVVGGRDVTALAGKELAKFRREDLGFISRTRTCWTRSRRTENTRAGADHPEGARARDRPARA